jgi:hypothetical protein
MFHLNTFSCPVHFSLKSDGFRDEVSECARIVSLYLNFQMSSNMSLKVYMCMMILCWSKTRGCSITTVLQLYFRICQETQVGLKLNRTHQLLAYADDVNLLRDNINTIKKNMETLIDATKEVGLEINVDKTKYMLLSRHHNVGQNRDIKIAKIN